MNVHSNSSTSLSQGQLLNTSLFADLIAVGFFIIENSSFNYKLPENWNKYLRKAAFTTEDVYVIEIVFLLLSKANAAVCRLGDLAHRAL